MDTIHICTAIDRNYRLPLTALVNSIHKNSSSHKCIVHVLFTGLSEKYRNKLTNKYTNTNLYFDFIDMSKYNFDFDGIDMQYWTKAIFYRIMIPEIFKNYERILYIDGDTLVLKDLYDFFNTPFDSDINMAMIVDRFSWKEQMRKLNISNYFNSGVILFDVKKCLENDFCNKCVQWLSQNKNKAIFPDQDAINVVCDKRILRVNNSFNKQIAIDDYNKLDNDAYIAHFLSAKKPWMIKHPRNVDKLYVTYITSFTSKMIVHTKHNLYRLGQFCFHVKHSVNLIKGQIVPVHKYYVFNICVFTKRHISIDIKRAFEIKKEA